MKKLFRTFLIFVILSLIGAYMVGAQMVSAQTFASDVVWIDVRSASEYQKGHLSAAVNIPHKKIGERIVEVVTEKDAQIKLYCGSGRRAGFALEALEDLGHTHVTNEGGYKGLLKSGH